VGIGMKRYAGILFDFDFTLVDSSEGVYVCINHALSEMGFPPVGKNRTDKLIGLSLVDTFWELTGIAEDTQAERFARLFLEKADVVMVDKTIMLPGVTKAIPRLAEQGYRMGIVSTKRHYPIKSILERDNMGGYFSVIVGGDEVRMPKPDPEGSRMALSSMGLAPDAVLYVGDSRTDALTARNAGLDFAAVMTGVTDREAFAGAVGIFEDLAELAGMLR
jgi:phosphoglycolate phosphatase